MKKFLVFIAVFFALGSVALADPGHDVLAYSSGDWAWFAHVSSSKLIIADREMGSGEQTEFFARHSGPGEQWKALPPLTGRALALASRMSQLAVLMNDGQWFTLWSDGSATGEPLPGIQSTAGGGRMVTLADDGTDLWAVGSINGGMAAASKALIREIASTMPSTTPVVEAAATTVPAGSTAPRLVLFRMVESRWAIVAEVPSDAPLASDSELSLSIAGGVPLVSFRSLDGSVGTLRYAENGWQSVGSVKAATTQPITNFRVLGDGFKPMLWLTTGNDPGELFPGFTESQNAPAPVKLVWPGAAQLDKTPTAAFAGGYVCVFGLHGEKVLEQRYRSSGVPVETPAELLVPETNDGPIPHWLEAVLLAFLGFSVGAKVFRNWLAGDAPPEIETPAPAPLLPRFTAGLIDALPVIAAVAFVFLRADVSPLQGDLPSTRTIIIIGGAVAVYLLHTTLAELFTGRSAGKWLLGLKVVTLEGNPPTSAQFLMRNLLRIVDPLVMIIFSPLRQRDADSVANTMVIRTGTKPAGTSANELKESDANKTDSH